MASTSAPTSQQTCIELLRATNRPGVSIVLPTFNESKNVRELLRQIDVALTAADISYECIFVDDSTDDTATVALTEALAYPGRVTLIKRTGAAAKSGLTRAFQCGFTYVRGPAIVCMDTDLQHPPATIPRLITALNRSGVEVAVASRYTLGGSTEGLEGYFRHIVSRVTTMFSHALLPGTRTTTDPMTGFFAFRRDLLQRIQFSSFGFKILVELLSSLQQPRVIDVPLTFRRREHEASKATLRQGIVAYRDIIRLFLTGNRGSESIRFGLVTGCLAVGAVALEIPSMAYAKVMWAGESTGAALRLAFTEGAAAMVANPLTESVTIATNSGHTFWWTISYFGFVGILASFLTLAWVVGQKQFRRLTIETGTLYAVYAILFATVTWYSFSWLMNVSTMNSFLTLCLAVLLSQTLVYVLFHPLWHRNYDRARAPERWTIFGVLLLLGTTISYFAHNFVWWESLLLILYGLVILQGLFALYIMVYTWERGDYEVKKPRPLPPPHYSFTAIVPCKHEKNTIADTIRAMHRINYPAQKKQILVVIHEDTDDGTITIARETIAGLGHTQVQLVTYNEQPVSKPHGLNKALAVATGDFVTIFDAEDEPHPDLFRVINAELVRDEVDVIQSGVQLMNYDSNWYSTFNVLEYFFWFKSSLHFFAAQGVVPLGGVSVFFRRNFLESVGGWDMECLTEDAEIGIRLSQAGARMTVLYDATYATQEETPPTLVSFIKQRTRWAQGFLQILGRGTFWYFPTLRQRLLALYVLSWPIIIPALFLLLPFGLIMMVSVSLDPMLAVIANVSLLLFLSFVVVQVVGFYEFTRAYQKPFSWGRAALMVVMFYPYTLLLMAASVRAVYRLIRQNHSWEKTEHHNIHRQAVAAPVVTPQS